MTRPDRWTPAQRVAACYIEAFGGWWALPVKYRRAHATYTRLLKGGVPSSEMPPEVVRREQVYQAARYMDRQLRARRRNLG